MEKNNKTRENKISSKNRKKADRVEVFWWEIVPLKEWGVAKVGEFEENSVNS